MNNIKDINAHQEMVFRANIDSINVACDNGLSKLFSNKDKYEILLLKRKKSGFEDPALYYTLFGRSMFNVVDEKGKEKRVCPYMDIYAIKTKSNAKIRVVVPVAKKNRHIIEFAGLQQYNHNSKEMVAIVEEMREELEDCTLNRVDIAIDFWGELPESIERNILRRRKKEKYKNTTYYTSKKQKTKRNTYVNILSYEKSKKNRHLQQNSKITRLEFQFGSKIKNFKVQDFLLATRAMEKYICKIANIDISIDTKLMCKKILSDPIKEKYMSLQNDLYLLITRVHIGVLRVENMLLHIQYYEMKKSQDMLSEQVRQMQERLAVIGSSSIKDHVEWTTLSILAEQKGLTRDAIRKQLQSGSFEEGVDFKTDGNRIIVHQGAVGRIHRKRRSSHG